MEVDHPSIPPNCPYFIDGNKHPEKPLDVILFVWGDDKQIDGAEYTRCTILSDIKDEYEKPIIAAVAHCGWLDEADETPPCGTNCLNRGECAHCIAERNAEAWRKWGRGEAWK